MTTTFAQRIATARARIAEQDDYRKRCQAFGLPAILAPYTVAVARVPRQRAA